MNVPDETGIVAASQRDAAGADRAPDPVKWSSTLPTPARPLLFSRMHCVRVFIRCSRFTWTATVYCWGIV